MSLTSTAPTSGFHVAGNTIQVTAVFDVNVTVAGTPHFELDLGAAGSTAVRQAAYVSGSDTTNLVFSYTVADGDDDPDGISWAANSLKLNGGTIQFTSTEATHQVDATLDHGAHDARCDPQGGCEEAGPGHGVGERRGADADLRRGPGRRGFAGQFRLRGEENAGWRQPSKRSR